MGRIIVNSSTGGQLSPLNQPVSVCDEAGQFLGIFTPAKVLVPEISDEELQRREQEEGSFSTEEVLKYLESL